MTSSPPTTRKQKTSYPKNKIKILLLENIHECAVQVFKSEEFQVESLKGALSEAELKEKIKDVHALGIRSKTKVTKEVLDHAERLLCIGCFCIGTDQVDLDAAQLRGIAVFNSPYANSRSVAELIIGQIIVLARRLGDKNKEMHKGIWDKASKNCLEIRGKTLGIVGYGHIGTQLGVLAESLGMQVIFYDIVSKLALGNAKAVFSLQQLLSTADFVTMHVPKTPETTNMIGEKEIKLMKKGSYLLNASRGSVVVLEALTAALQSGHLHGAYIDVYPTEPEENTNKWENILQNLPNVTLTPHIGGSTEEAQRAIGDEVSRKLVKYINSGSTYQSVNFPEIELPYGGENTHRILNVHRNVPGVLKNINTLLGEVNVQGQILRTVGQIGYIIVDVEQEASESVKKAISDLSSSIKTRVLY